MFKFLKRHQEKQKAEEQMQKARYEQAEKDILAARAQMLQSPCPLNNGQNCFAGCIHFREGDICWMPSIPPYLYKKMEVRK